jgi:hypothetical protein
MVMSRESMHKKSLFASPFDIIFDMYYFQTLVEKTYFSYFIKFPPLILMLQYHPCCSVNFHPPDYSVFQKSSDTVVRCLLFSSPPTLKTVICHAILISMCAQRNSLKVNFYCDIWKRQKYWCPRQKCLNCWLLILWPQTFEVISKLL